MSDFIPLILLAIILGLREYQHHHQLTNLLSMLNQKETINPTEVIRVAGDTMVQTVKELMGQPGEVIKPTETLETAGLDVMVGVPENADTFHTEFAPPWEREDGSGW